MDHKQVPVVLLVPPTVWVTRRMVLALDEHKASMREDDYRTLTKWYLELVQEARRGPLDDCEHNVSCRRKVHPQWVSQSDPSASISLQGPRAHLIDQTNPRHPDGLVLHLNARPDR